MLGLYISCIALLCRVTLVTSQTSANAKDLRTQLFVTDGYDKRILPATNQADPVEVYLNFYLLAINGLDEVNEVLKTTGYLSISWYDGFLQWDPANYGGIAYYLWPQGDIWKPDVALKNSNKQYIELGVDTLNVQVSAGGLVNWRPFQVFESTCSMNIRFFPFDVQECSLRFVAWSYNSAEVDMQSGDSGLLLDEYESNSAWDIIETNWNVEQMSGEAAISFTIKMKRKPLFVVLSVILPITLLAVLNIFVFVLPCDSGERSGYAVTVFLALAVFLTIVSSTLPANSDTVALFSIYLIIQTVQSTMITLIALAMLRMYSFGEKVVESSCLVAMLKMYDRMRCENCKQRNQVDEFVNNGKKAEGGEIGKSVKVNEASEKANEYTRKGSMISCQSEEKKYTWLDVIKMLDVLFVIFFTAVFLLSTTVFFGQAIVGE